MTKLLSVLCVLSFSASFRSSCPFVLSQVELYMLDCAGVNRGLSVLASCCSSSFLTNVFKILIQPSSFESITYICRQEANLKQMLIISCSCCKEMLITRNIHLQLPNWMVVIFVQYQKQKVVLTCRLILKIT